MVSLSGLSAVYPGYQQADSNDAQTRLKKAQATGAETELAGDAAFGNTLKMMQAQIPGAQPMPGAQGPPMQGGQPPPQMAQGPQAPEPGLPSVRMRPPQPMQPPMPQGQPQPQGGAPMQPQGQPQGQPGPQGGGPGMQGGQGQLDWRVIMGKVAQANPNAPPQVLAAAVNKFLPLMNQQAQMEWKNVSLALAAQRANTGQESADTRRNQGNQRIDIQKGAEERRTEQGDRRLDQGDTRNDMAADREKRLAAASTVRQDQGYQRLDMQRQDLERKVIQGNDRQALSQWRAVLDAQHKRAQEIIQSSNFGNTMDAKDKKNLLADQDQAYRAAIEEMRNKTGRSTPEGNKPAASGKTNDRAPEGNPASPVVLPPEAKSQLQEGHVTTFNNGQKWTLKNGQPEQVP